MKTFNKLFSLAAIAIFGLSACEQEKLSVNSSIATHTVTFIAETSETKTVAGIENGTVKYSFTESDLDRINIYENGEKGTIVKENSSVTEGIMSLTATFAGNQTEAEKVYTAVLNGGSISTQVMYSEAYDEDADILVAEPVSTVAATDIKFCFKREVAIAKMTLKGLGANEIPEIVTITSDKDLAGAFDGKDWTFPTTAIELTSSAAMEVGDYEITANEAGEAVIWFTCIPQEDSNMSVSVTTKDGKNYSKTFSRPLSLTRNNITAFSVALEETQPSAISYIIVFNSTVSGITSIAKTTKAATFVVEGSEYLIAQPVADFSNAYYGGNATNGLPLRVGKSSEAGSITLTLSEAGQVPASKITLSAKQYSSGKTKTIGVNGSAKQQPGDDYTDLFFDLDGNDLTTIKLDTDGYIYIKSITVEYGGVVKTKLAKPENITVDGTKMVSWDAVEGAAAYILTIGEDEYPCETNSYDAAALKDDYYNITVVALPADTENFKNSDAAVLRGAKFGTPTLVVPELKEGAIDENSLNVTWSVDPRATAGYNCELYNGETKIGDSKTVSTGSVTFTGLNDGMAYTIKVNALATTGEKPYAASEIATIELTTKAASHVSDVTTEGTYTIKGLTVYAVPNTSNAIVGDETGYILYYKSYHGLKIGDTFDVSGSTKLYNGVWEFDNATISNKVAGETPDYGTPLDVTVDYLASYEATPQIKYVRARGIQNGRKITINGSNIPLYMSADNMATDGKDVEVYGFVFGWFAKNSNISFVATSIEENPDAPKLSVTPASKTWANDETSAAVFNINVANGDWSVTPETLDWAVINIDKVSNTITVTPNGENTTDAAYEATLTLTHSADPSLTQTITLKQAAAGGTETTTPTDVLFDFTQISDFSLWGNSYATGKHVIDYSEATVTFESATKQNQTITDRPVSKGSAVIVVMKNSETINSLEFTCQQWTTKTQTITLNTSTDGGITWKPTEKKSSNFVLTVDNIETGVNAIKFTFSSTSNQIGFTSLKLNYNKKN